MSEAIRSGIMTNYVSLLEVAHYLRNQTKNEYSNMVDSIENLSTLVLTELDAQTAALALDLVPVYASKGLGVRDCVILSSIQLSGVTSIANHDRSFREIKGITVVDDIPQKI
jgi:predicted nucleic acid-binding protein